jgi:hypothetical protein
VMRTERVAEVYEGFLFGRSRLGSTQMIKGSRNDKGVQVQRMYKNLRAVMVSG